MGPLSRFLEDLSTLQVLLLVVAVIVGGSLLAALVGGLLVRLGMRSPRVLRGASGLSIRALEVIKRPLTIVVLEEVAAVIQTGRYTRNISDALLENHHELKALVAEKVRADPNARVVKRLPGYDAIVSEVSETTLRVIVEMLSDPRMDELVSDLLRNNIEQIRSAVRDREHEAVEGLEPADPIPAGAPVPEGRRVVGTAGGDAECTGRCRSRRRNDRFDPRCGPFPPLQSRRLRFGHGADRPGMRRRRGGQHVTGLPFPEWLSQNQAEVIFRFQQHFLLSIYCVAIAAVVGLLIALATYRVTPAANVSIGAIAVAFTIPSVALFGFVYSITGDPLLTIVPVVAMYGLLPITRNAIVGLQSADPAVIDAAKGMGVGRFRMLWQIRLPIAWPVILAGLRVSTQLTVGILAIGAFIAPYGLGIFAFNALNNLGSVNTGNEALACVIFVVADRPGLRRHLRPHPPIHHPERCPCLSRPWTSPPSSTAPARPPSRRTASRSH